MKEKSITQGDPKGYALRTMMIKRASDEVQSAADPVAKEKAIWMAENSPSGDPVILEGFERRLNEYDTANANRDGDACDGTWSGSNFDCAGVCDGSSAEDCSGECDGSSSEDVCGVCDGDSFVDCNGDCAAGYESWVGDGYCDDGSWGLDFVCIDCDGGDCLQNSDPDAACYSCDFADCIGQCAEGYESWVGDGYCDDGAYGLYFDCDAFSCDNGDCLDECGDCGGDGIDEGACDCDGNVMDDCGECGGGNECHDCAGVPYGDSVDDCDGSGECWGGGWVGDGFCDGAAQDWGADLTCYDCDGGDCIDECGVCDGSGIADGECDCDGNTDDCCGECGGDNSSCGGSGDTNGGGVDVTDVVAMVGDILGTATLDECAANEADMNGDGGTNVMDVILAVEAILSGQVGGCTDEAADNYNADADYDDGSCEYAPTCDEGYVLDCADDDCCPASWVGDGFEDCEDQAYGCDLTCYDDDGGDCADPFCGDGNCDADEDDASCPDDCASSEACSDCEFDFTNYGAECCDTAWDDFGINCAALESNYNWDCAGCACPGDEAGEECGNGYCAGDETCDSCPEDCACIPEEWTCADGYYTDTWCDCGCGAYDPVCDDPDASQWDNCADGCVDPTSPDCNEPTEGCADGEYECSDGACIPDYWECDGWGDCSDSGDEASCGSEACSDCEYDFTAYGSECCDTAADAFGIDCATLEANYYWDCSGCNCPLDGAGCADGEFDCGDGQCIYGSWECDGWSDCSNGADEADCAAGCSDDQFDCLGDGTECIPSGYYCDGSSEFCNAGWGPDCSNGADEGLDTCGYTDDCAAGCADDEFTCDDGACIPGSWECDVYYCDCAGCEDEASCGGDECVNDDSTSDSYGDTCSSWYDSYEYPGSGGCSGNYDDDDFNAAEQCCACQGDRADSADLRSMKEKSITQGDPKGYAVRTMAIKLASAVTVKSAADPVAKEKAIWMAENNQVVETQAGVKPVESMVVKSIVKAKAATKNPADVIKSGASSLNRKAAPQFESKLQRAESVKLIQTAEGLKYEADGYVGFEITLSHGADFTINVTESSFIADYATTGNTTKVIVVGPETDNLFSSTGDYTVVDVIAGTAGGTALSADIVSVPTVFGLSGAYPNPFNPTTSVELAMPQDGFVSVKVYNLMGQIVATLHEGNLTANSYNFSWDAADVASGMYFLKAETAGRVDIQKIMFMK
jgi:hypothetical protein